MVAIGQDLSELCELKSVEELTGTRLTLGSLFDPRLMYLGAFTIDGQRFKASMMQLKDS